MDLYSFGFEVCRGRLVFQGQRLIGVKNYSELVYFLIPVGVAVGLLRTAGIRVVYII